MKKRLLLFIFFIIKIKAQLGFNVIYEADYKLVYKSQINSPNTQEEAFALLMNDNESYYKNMNKYVEDSLRAERKFNDNSPIGDQMKYIVGHPENIGVTKGKIYVTVPFSNKEFKYEESNYSDWKLTSDSKIIGNYRCQKAILKKYGRVWMAYFTKEIPLPFGPYKFNGLPGLILEIYDSKKDYIFTLYSFRKRKYFCKSANIYPNAISVEKSKVFDFRRKELSDASMFSKYIEDPEVRISLIKKAAERAKKYNPIELKIE